VLIKADPAPRGKRFLDFFIELSTGGFIRKLAQHSNLSTHVLLNHSALPSIIDLMPRSDDNTCVRFQEPQLSETLHAGLLLVALPSLMDSHFRRTILLITHHDQEGAMGFILNRPRIESLGELSDAPKEVAVVQVFEGGPVDQQHLILTRLIWKETGVRFQSLGVENLVHKIGETIREEGNLLAFTGYAGWTAGQLEQEISEKSWHLLKPTAEMLHPVSTPEEGIHRWKAIMKDLGSMYHLLAQAPDDPGLN